MFIPGINQFVGQKENSFDFSDYQQKLDELMAFSHNASEIKVEMRKYNDEIIGLLDGAVLPFEIAKNFNFIPEEVISNVREVNWVLDRRIHLEWLYEFLCSLDGSEKIVLWHLIFSEEFLDILGAPKDKKLKLHVVSHGSLRNRIMNCEFLDEVGRDGSLDNFRFG